MTRQRRTGTAGENVCADKSDYVRYPDVHSKNLSVIHSHSRLLRSDQIGKSLARPIYDSNPSTSYLVSRVRGLGDQLLNLHTVINVHSLLH